MNLEGSYFISKLGYVEVKNDHKNTLNRPFVTFGFDMCQTFFAKGSKLTDPSLFIRLDMPIFVHKKSSKVFLNLFFENSSFFIQKLLAPN